MHEEHGLIELSMYVRPSTIAPDAVTSILAVQPTLTRRKGEHHGAPGGPPVTASRSAFWRRSRPPFIDSDADRLTTELRALVDGVAPSSIAALRGADPGARVEVVIDIWCAPGRSGRPRVISGEVLALLAPVIDDLCVFCYDEQPASLVRQVTRGERDQLQT